MLLAEFNGRRVTERNFKGDILWTKTLNGNPMSAQRLANGNTFVAMQNQLVEVDRAGTEVFNMQRPNHDLFRARKLRTGDVIFITNQGTLTRIDPKTQKEIKSFAVGNIGNLFGSIDVLPNGNVVVPQFGNNRVVEFDANGREVCSAEVQPPMSVVRLPNGNTLVGSVNTREVAELNRTGGQAWTYTAEGQVFQARRRYRRPGRARKGLPDFRRRLYCRSRGAATSSRRAMRRPAPTRPSTGGPPVP